MFAKGLFHHTMLYLISTPALLSLLCVVPKSEAFSPIALDQLARVSPFQPSPSSLFTQKDAESAFDFPSRRQALLSLTGAVVGLSGVSTTQAAVTDETDAFANTAFDSAYRGLQSDRPLIGVAQSAALPSDELVIMVPKSEISKGLGLELSQVEFRTNVRVFVKSVTPNSVAARLGIKKDYVVVSINGKSAERTNAEGVAIMVSQAAKAPPAGDSIEIRFRDPSVFRESLKELSASGEVTTQVAPAGDTTQRNLDGSIKLGRVETEQTDQRLTVTQLIPPKMCRRGATTDDLLEISYLGTVVETGEIFDGSAIKINGDGIPGRGNDVSLFFVLGKQPFGQFPPGWDVGLDGMCVGERRRLIIPPVLAYGATGVPRRRIPPNATLQYDITLVSLNGLATPQ
jgi:FK506-binding protein 2